jgi:hypothetical protein
VQTAFYASSCAHVCVHCCLDNKGHELAGTVLSASSAYVFITTAVNAACANSSAVWCVCVLPCCRWIATEANNDYRMCTPPGLIYARAGEMRANNKVLVLQV